MTEKYSPRFLFEITEEQQARANRHLNVHGIRKAVFGVILDDFLDLIEEHGQMVIGIILNRAAKPREVLPSLNEAERKSK